MKKSGFWNKRVFQPNRLTGCLGKVVFEVPVDCLYKELPMHFWKILFQLGLSIAVSASGDY